MQWNWQRSDWPKFRYEKERIAVFEEEFLHHTGQLFGAHKHLDQDDRNAIRIELLSGEAWNTSEIEGEFLDRDSLQSSIRRHFGLQTDGRKIPPAEAGIAAMMVSVYQDFEAPLSDTMLFDWHRQVMNGRTDLESLACYWQAGDPMQIVSGRLDEPKVHFEAPPAYRVVDEMASFVTWFNRSGPDGLSPLPAIARAGIAHLYFESVHPFEDGNGRIGRAISEKVLAQALGQPSLIALATILAKDRKRYYRSLEMASRENEVTEWLCYFAESVLKALRHTESSIEFLIGKTRLLDGLRGKLNQRQEKCLLRIFREGPDGFRGGLSAKNYMSITGATRPTATRDLRELVALEALRREGEKKATRYHLNLPSQ